MPKADRRILRTQRALFGAMIELILENGFDSMTVAEIAERANVGRSTFYAHYADKQDLLQGSIAGLSEFLREHVEAALARPEVDTHPALSFCLPMAEHVAENRNLHAMFQRGGGGALVAELMHEMWAELIRVGWPEGDPVAVETIAGGFGATISWWLAKAPELEPASVVARFVSLVQPGIGSA